MGGEKWEQAGWSAPFYSASGTQELSSKAPAYFSHWELPSMGRGEQLPPMPSSDWADLSVWKGLEPSLDSTGDTGQRHSISQGKLPQEWFNLVVPVLFSPRAAIFVSREKDWHLYTFVFYWENGDALRNWTSVCGQRFTCLGEMQHEKYNRLDKQNIQSWTKARICLSMNLLSSSCYSYLNVLCATRAEIIKISAPRG